MCGCYDGNIYAYDKLNGTDIHQMQGPGKMLLHFDIVNNKVSRLNCVVLFDNVIL